MPLSTKYLSRKINSILLLLYTILTTPLNYLHIKAKKFLRLTLVLSFNKKTTHLLSDNQQSLKNNVYRIEMEFYRNPTSHNDSFQKHEMLYYY